MNLGGIWPSWVIEPLEERDVSDSLEELNLHLKKLDWMAKNIFRKAICYQNFTDSKRTFYTW